MRSQNPTKEGHLYGDETTFP